MVQRWRDNQLFNHLTRFLFNYVTSFNLAALPNMHYRCNVVVWTLKNVCRIAYFVNTYDIHTYLPLVLKCFPLLYLGIICIPLHLEVFKVDQWQS